MTLDEAENAVLWLKKLPQIEDTEMTFADEGAYVVSARTLGGQTLTWLSNESFADFLHKELPKALITNAILGPNDVPVPCTHQAYILWYVKVGKQHCEKRSDQGDGWGITTLFQGVSASQDGPHLFWRVGKLPSGEPVFELFGTKEAALQYHQSIVYQIGRAERG